MSGDSGDSGNSAVWTFRTGQVTSGTCTVSVFVPDDHDIRHAGGNPSYYSVHNGTSGSASQLTGFNVTQVSHWGQWVTAPAVRITGGTLSVVLHDRGKDWDGDGANDAHHAVDAVRAQCKA